MRIERHSLQLLLGQRKKVVRLTGRTAPKAPLYGLPFRPTWGAFCGQALLGRVKGVGLRELLAPPYFVKNVRTGWEPRKHRLILVQRP